MLDSYKFKSNIEKSSIFFLVLAFLFLPFSLAAHNASLALTVLTALLSGSVWRKRDSLWKEPLVWSLLALFFWVCVGSFYSLSTWNDALGTNFNKYSKLFFGVFLIAILLNKKAREYAFFAFSVGMFFVLISTYLNIWFEVPWSVTKNQGWGMDHTVFGNYITQNIMMSFFALQGIFFIFTNEARWKKWFWIIVTGLAIISIMYLSSGRTGYVVLLAGIILYIVFALPKKWSWLGVIAIVLASLVAFSTSSRVQERYELAISETQLIFEQNSRGELPTFSSIGARWYMWMKSLELVQERPILGWGLGSHGIKWCEKAPEPVWCQVGDTTPHNQFIFFAVELGIVGLILFLLLISTLCWAGWQGGKYRPLMMGFIAIFLVDSMVNASLWNAREYNFFILMMCLLYTMIRFEDKNEIH